MRQAWLSRLRAGRPGSPHGLISAGSRHAFRPTVRNASSRGRSIARMAGVFVDPSAAE